MKETEKTDSIVAGDECITAGKGEGWHSGDSFKCGFQKRPGREGDIPAKASRNVRGQAPSGEERSRQAGGVCKGAK